MVPFFRFSRKGSEIAFVVFSNTLPCGLNETNRGSPRTAATPPVQTTNQERTKVEMLLLIDGNLLSLQFFFPRVTLKKQFHYRKKDKQPQERHGSYLLRAQSITTYEISFSPGHHPKTSSAFFR